MTFRDFQISEIRTLLHSVTPSNLRKTKKKKIFRRLHKRSHSCGHSTHSCWLRFNITSEKLNIRVVLPLECKLTTRVTIAGGLKRRALKITFFTIGRPAASFFFHWGQRQRDPLLPRFCIQYCAGALKQKCYRAEGPRMLWSKILYNN